MRRMASCLLTVSLAACAPASGTAIKTVAPSRTATDVQQLQAEVRSVNAGAGQVELWVQFEWAPRQVKRDQPLQVSLGSDTAFVPVDSSLASLHPGDSVEVAVDHDDAGAHARQVVLVDPD